MHIHPTPEQNSMKRLLPFFLFILCALPASGNDAVSDHLKRFVRIMCDSVTDACTGGGCQMSVPQLNLLSRSLGDNLQYFAHDFLKSNGFSIDSTLDNSRTLVLELSAKRDRFGALSITLKERGGSYLHIKKELLRGQLFEPDEYNRLDAGDDKVPESDKLHLLRRKAVSIAAGLSPELLSFLRRRYIKAQIFVEPFQESGQLDSLRNLGTAVQIMVASGLSSSPLLSIISDTSGAAGNYDYIIKGNILKLGKRIRFDLQCVNRNARIIATNNATTNVLEVRHIAQVLQQPVLAIRDIIEDDFRTRKTEKESLTLIPLHPVMGNLNWKINRNDIETATWLCHALTESIQPLPGDDLSLTEIPLKELRKIAESCHTGEGYLAKTPVDHLITIRYTLLGRIWLKVDVVYWRREERDLIRQEIFSEKITVVRLNSRIRHIADNIRVFFTDTLHLTGQPDSPELRNRKPVEVRIPMPFSDFSLSLKPASWLFFKEAKPFFGRTNSHFLEGSLHFKWFNVSGTLFDESILWTLYPEIAAGIAYAELDLLPKGALFGHVHFMGHLNLTRQFGRFYVNLYPQFSLLGAEVVKYLLYEGDVVGGLKAPSDYSNTKVKLSWLAGIGLETYFTRYVSLPFEVKFIRSWDNNGSFGPTTFFEDKFEDEKHWSSLSVAWGLSWYFK